MDADALAKLQDMIVITNAVKEQSDKMRLQIQQLTSDVAMLKEKLANLERQPDSAAPSQKKLQKAEGKDEKPTKVTPAAATAGAGVVLHVIPAYSDKAMVVYGKDACMMLKDRVLKPNNFSFNKSLRCGAGWIISRSKMTVQQLTALLKADPEGQKISVVVDSETDGQDNASSGDKRKQPDVDDF